MRTGTVTVGSDTRIGDQRITVIEQIDRVPFPIVEVGKMERVGLEILLRLDAGRANRGRQVDDMTARAKPDRGASTVGRDASRGP